MIKITSDSGEGRTFILIHERGEHREFIAQANDALLQRVRVVVLESEMIAEQHWEQLAKEFSQVILDLSIRQCALIGFGAAGSLVQYLTLSTPKIVRSLILVDSSFRPHPTPLSRGIDWIEQILPLGLPFRWSEEGFDAKPFAQRIRCPALIVLSDSASPFISQQAHEMAARIPSAWVVKLESNNQIAHFCELLDSFESVPVKCPQKNVR